MSKLAKLKMLKKSNYSSINLLIKNNVSTFAC